MIYLLILFPLVMAAVTFAVPSNRWRPWLLPLGALGHLALVVGGDLRPAGRRRRSRAWAAGCCSTRWARSSSAS